MEGTVLKESISASDFKNMLLCADVALHSNMQSINELNVFPVPDGDTGTNMSLTVNNAATELAKKDYFKISDVADAAASGMLRGARGNSGVITSLLFRGLSKKLKGLETATAEDYATAMKSGVDAAYKAVMKPAEGTILTVSRKAADAAMEYTKNGGTAVEEMLEASLIAGKEALAETMNQNPVLQKAGVIDAGGKGYITIYEAMLSCLRGETDVPAQGAVHAEDAEGSVFEKFDTEDITFAYDTVFIVRKTVDKSLDLLRAYLDSIGDSLVIGEDDECFKVHVHTNIPGDALTEAQKYGTLETAKIENMRTQHDELVESGFPAEPAAPAEPEKEFGSVAVCAGDGLAELFREIGVDTIVTGGQTMNPSTNDILTEINKTNAKTVFVLPNNKNIIMAAEQCKSLTDKNVIVIPTKTVPQGISAMLCFEPENDETDIVNTMTEAIAKVHTAQITYAARDSEFDGHHIKAGEYLALLDGSLVGSFPGFQEVIDGFIPPVKELNPELITLYYGEDVTEEEAEKTGEVITECFPEAEISVVYGGQPVYYYMVSIE